MLLDSDCLRSTSQFDQHRALADNVDEPCVGPKQRIGRFEMETTMALLGQRRRSPTERDGS